MKNESLESMKAEGFTGPDASLNESLVEYGLAWRVKDGDLLFYYRCPYQKKKFQWGRVSLDTDPFEEWDWALEGENLKGFLSSMGLIEDDFRNLPLPQQVYSLYQYQGALEIFGEAYSEGFTIAGLEW